MKQYTVSELREHLADALDQAERGEPVMVARRGRRFHITAVAPRRPRASGKPFFRVTDPRLLESGWTWEWTAPGAPVRLRTTRQAGRLR